MIEHVWSVSMKCVSLVWCMISLSSFYLNVDLVILVFDGVGEE
jgi:hypothetical protein